MLTKDEIHFKMHMLCHLNAIIQLNLTMFFWFCFFKKCPINKLSWHQFLLIIRLSGDLSVVWLACWSIMCSHTKSKINKCSLVPTKRFPRRFWNKHQGFQKLSSVWDVTSTDSRLPVNVLGKMSQLQRHKSLMVAVATAGVKLVTTNHRVMLAG